MEFPKTFKLFWWALLIGLSALYIIVRYDSIIAGDSSYLDIVVFLCFFSLLLMPLFQEIDIFGFRLKREIDLLRHDVKEQMLNLRTQIQNTINFRPEISPRFYYGQIPTDEQIQVQEQRLSQIVEETLREYGIKEPERLEFSVQENTKYLFMVKFEIEKEMKRIYAKFFPEKITQVPFPMYKMTTDLVHEGLFSEDLYEHIRSIMNICNRAIHGEDVTERQVEFVRNTIEELISILGFY